MADLRNQPVVPVLPPRPDVPPPSSNNVNFAASPSKPTTPNTSGASSTFASIGNLPLNRTMTIDQMKSEFLFVHAYTKQLESMHDQLSMLMLKKRGTEERGMVAELELLEKELSIAKDRLKKVRVMMTQRGITGGQVEELLKSGALNQVAGRVQDAIVGWQTNRTSTSGPGGVSQGTPGSRQEQEDKIFQDLIRDINMEKLTVEERKEVEKRARADAHRRQLLIEKQIQEEQEQIKREEMQILQKEKEIEAGLQQIQLNSNRGTTGANFSENADFPEVPASIESAKRAWQQQQNMMGVRERGPDGMFVEQGTSVDRGRMQGGGLMQPTEAATGGSKIGGGVRSLPDAPSVPSSASGAGAVPAQPLDDIQVRMMIEEEVARRTREAEMKLWNEHAKKAKELEEESMRRMMLLTEEERLRQTDRENKEWMLKFMEEDLAKKEEEIRRAKEEEMRLKRMPLTVLVQQYNPEGRKGEILPLQLTMGDTLLYMKSLIPYDADYFKLEIVHMGRVLELDDKMVGLDYGLPNNAMVESYIKPIPGIDVLNLIPCEECGKSFPSDVFLQHKCAKGTVQVLPSERRDHARRVIAEDDRRRRDQEERERRIQQEQEDRLAALRFQQQANRDRQTPAYYPPKSTDYSGSRYNTSTTLTSSSASTLYTPQPPAHGRFVPVVEPPPPRPVPAAVLPPVANPNPAMMGQWIKCDKCGELIHRETMSQHMQYCKGKGNAYYTQY